MWYSVDQSCEKCPTGTCERFDGKCIIYNNGYHCLLGDYGDVKCNYGSNCIHWGEKQLYSWIGSSANLTKDKCYNGNFLNAN